MLTPVIHVTARRSRGTKLHIVCRCSLRWRRRCCCLPAALPAALPAYMPAALPAALFAALPAYVFRLSHVARSQSRCLIPSCRGKNHDMMQDLTSRSAKAEHLDFAGIPADAAEGGQACPALEFSSFVVLFSPRP